MNSETDRHALSEHVSKSGFAKTLDILAVAIRSAGMQIFTTIDHAAGAAAVGIRMPPTVVLLYGNPRSGTPLMRVAPSVALDLPLRVLVREDGVGRTVVAFHPIVPLLTSAGLPEQMARNLEPAQRLLIDALRDST